MSADHFVDGLFCRRIIMSADHFVDGLFCRRIIMSADHFVDGLFCLRIILSTDRNRLIKSQDAMSEESYFSIFDEYFTFFFKLAILFRPANQKYFSTFILKPNQSIFAWFGK